MTGGTSFVTDKRAPLDLSELGINLNIMQSEDMVAVADNNELKQKNIGNIQAERRPIVLLPQGKIKLGDNVEFDRDDDIESLD